MTPEINQLETCLPLLKLAEGKTAIILAPLPRYLYSRCCSDESHVTGLGKPGPKEKIREAVEKSRVFLKDFAWYCGIRYAKAINPGKAILDSAALEEDDDWRAWEEDPVHPKTHTHNYIAESIILHADGLKGAAGKRKGGPGWPASANKQAKLSKDSDWNNTRRDFFSANPRVGGRGTGRGSGWKGSRGFARPRPFRDIGEAPFK